MKINEITRPPTIEDADKFLRSRGYHRIGYGTFGAVYQKRKRPDQVVKLFTSDDTAYIKYLEMIKNTNNPHFPKIYGNPVRINAKYYAIKQEKLSESVWKSPPLFEQYVDALVDGTEIDTNGFLGSRIAEYKEKYPQIEEALRLIANLVKSEENMMTDIHGANIMMRGDMLVFIDPVATRSALEFPKVCQLPKIHNWTDSVGVVFEESEKHAIPDQIDGKPTRNSLGKLIHPTIEGIKNFWKWFGDSKVVDSQGRPLVVYHGTGADFNEFDRNKSKRGNLSPGFYFAVTRDLAAAFAKKSTFNPVGGNIMPVYLRILKPQSGIDTGAESAGFDGIISDNTLVVFSPTQIKSAIGNNGNFSPNSKKITEVGFAHALGDLSVSQKEIISGSSQDGTVFGKTVRVFQSENQTVYFFADNEKISALIILMGDSLKAIKSFDKKKGSVFALINYLVNIKNMKLKIDSDEPLTPEGFQWLLKMIERESGIKVRDLNGNTVDINQLKTEWKEARNSMGTTNRSLGFIISESSLSWKNKLQENETRLIPFKYFKC